MDFFTKPATMGDVVLIAMLTFAITMMLAMAGIMQDNKVELQVQQAQAEAFDALSDRVKLLETQVTQLTVEEVKDISEQAASIKAEAEPVTHEIGGVRVGY